MKKKAALLLVLVMIITSLPMIAFGETPAPTNAPAQVGTVGTGFTAANQTLVFAPQFTLSTAWQRLISPAQHEPAGTINLIMNLTNARVNMNAFASNQEFGATLQDAFALLPNGNLGASLVTTTTGAAIDPIVTNTNAATSQGFVGFLAPNTAIALPFEFSANSGLDEDDFLLLLTGVTDDRRGLQLSLRYLGDPATLSTTQIGTLAFRIPLTSDDNDNWSQAWMHMGGQQITGTQQIHLINSTLVWSQPGRINITSQGGARGFSSMLPLNNVRVTETAFGLISNNGVHDSVWLLLDAPQFYTWSFGNNVSATNSNSAFPVVGPITPGRPGTLYPLGTNTGGSMTGATIEAVHSFRAPGTNDRHRIAIRVNIAQNPGLSHFPGWFEITNLWLQPDYNAPTSGEVRIDAHLARGFHMAPPTSGTANTQNPGVVGPGFGHVGTMETIMVPNPAYVPGAGVPAFIPHTTTVSAGDRLVLVGSTWHALLASTPANANLGAWSTNSSLFRLATAADAGNDFPVAQFFTSEWTGGAMGPESNWINWVITNPESMRSWALDLHVGNRGTATLSASVPNMIDMRTGHLGTWHQTNNSMQPRNAAGVNNVSWNRDNSWLGHWSGVSTATLFIEETIPGAFVFGPGAPITFEFLDENGNMHPGVRILGVQARAGNDNIGRRRDNPFYGFGLSGTTGFNSGTAAGRERQNWMTFTGWLSNLDQRLPVVPGVGRLSDSQATVYLPSQTISDMRSPGALEIRFFLSLEAGYEWKYGSDVTVSIGGAGASNLPEAQRTQVIGRAVDPIVASVTAANVPVTEVETGTLYNIIGRAPIEDVTLDVITNAAFEVGSEIWVYVTSDILARSLDLSLSSIPTLTVEGSALRFDTGRILRPSVGTHGREGVAFTVMRAPDAGDNPVITLSNLFVEGQAFPGVEYQIVVSGTAIANNDQEVYRANTSTAAEGGALRHMSRGVFTTLPYNGTVVANVFGGVWDHAPEGGPGGITVPPVRELRLWEGMGAVSGVDTPFFWHRLNDELVVGMVALRVFADFVGDSNPTWDQATQTAQVIAYDRNGNQVTLAVQANNTQAAIQNAGQPQQNVDIATAARGASGPAGTVMPLFVNDRIYLPLRFVAETFGYTVSMEGNVVVFR